jgi:hypothetical protein
LPHDYRIRRDEDGVGYEIGASLEDWKKIRASTYSEVGRGDYTRWNIPHSE